MLIVIRIDKDRIWKIRLFNSIKLIIHIIGMGVFLGDRFISIVLKFFKFMSIIVTHNNMVKERLKFIILVKDITLGIKFSRFNNTKMLKIGINRFINILLLIFEFLFIKVIFMIRFTFIIEMYFIHIALGLINITDIIIIRIKFKGIMFKLGSNRLNIFIRILFLIIIKFFSLNN